MQTIELSALLIAIIPALLVVIIQWQWSLQAKASVIAIARMLIQLCLIGYVLTYIFSSNSPILVLFVLSVMLLVSSWIALRTVPHARVQLYGTALTATLSINVLLLAINTQVVLNADPWFSPTILIPLAGMIFATGMNSISLFAERYFAERNRDVDENLARNTAYHATLIPIINSLLAVGLVSLPGMMTGQILSGVSPLIAVRYQVMVMLMLFAASGLTSALFYFLLKRKLNTNPELISNQHS